MGRELVCNHLSPRSGMHIHTHFLADRIVPPVCVCVCACVCACICVHVCMCACVCVVMCVCACVCCHVCVYVCVCCHVCLCTPCVYMYTVFTCKCVCMSVHACVCACGDRIRISRESGHMYRLRYYLHLVQLRSMCTQVSRPIHIHVLWPGQI